MSRVMYREDLDPLLEKCSIEGCKETHSENMTLYTKCHPGQGLEFAYNTLDGTLQALCHSCKKALINVQVASKTLEIKNPFVECDDHGVNASYAVCKHILDGKAEVSYTEQAELPQEGQIGVIFCAKCAEQIKEKPDSMNSKQIKVVCGGHAIDKKWIPIDWFQPR